MKFKLSARKKVDKDKEDLKKARRRIRELNKKYESELKSLRENIAEKDRVIRDYDKKHDWESQELRDLEAKLYKGLEKNE